jgi:apolipoprotein D and lipocalin family protein
VKHTIIFFVFFSFFIYLDVVSFPKESSNVKNSRKPQPVSSVDLKRYAGVWYEIAKIPNRFQKKCSQNTTAQYSLRTDGRIDVINRCVTKKGRTIEAIGIAKVVDTSTNSKLKVSFVRFLGIQLFWGDYWIIGLDSDYKYAIVGHPKRKYGWILSRNRKLKEKEWQEVHVILKEQGYDPNRFIQTKHPVK